MKYKSGFVNVSVTVEDSLLLFSLNHSLPTLQTNTVSVSKLLDVTVKDL